MRLTTRRDDADVIRARMRVLLTEGRRSGWLPDDDLDEPPELTDPADRHDDPDDDQPDDRGDPDDDRDEHRDEHRDDGRAGLPAGLGRHRAPGRTVRLDPGRPGSRALWAAGLLAALALAGWTWLDRPTVEPPPPVATTAQTAPPAAEGTRGTGEGSAEGSAEPGDGTSGEAGGGGTAGGNATVVVSVVGRVARPGLVTLPEGARVADAVAAAGGLLPEADPASVNLAAVVADGQQVAVGVPGAAPAQAPGTGAAPAGSGGPLDVNTATVGDLDALPGIGPVLAQRIVDHREDQGRFTSVEQLDDVPGIGPTTYAELADLVRV